MVGRPALTCLWWVLLASVGMRVGAAIYLGNTVESMPGTADQVSYHNLALRVLEGHGFSFGEAWWPATPAEAPTAHWSYLYTLYLVVVYSAFGAEPFIARLIQAISVGLLQPYLAYRIVLEAGGFGQTEGDRRALGTVALLAAGITAGYMYFVYYAAALMTEALFVTAILAGIALSIRLSRQISESTWWGVAIGLGVSLTVAVLLRQLFLLFVPFLFLWLAIVCRSRKRHSRVVGSLVLITAILAASILPITWFNYNRFGSFVLLNTNAGFAFFWANHPIHGSSFLDARELGEQYQRLIPSELKGLNEAELDRALLREGIGFVIDEPVRYFQLSLSRIPAYFKFWPDKRSSFASNVSRAASFGLLAPFMLYGLAVATVRSWRSSKALGSGRADEALILLYLFMLIYTGIHILSWALVRYRLPVDAVLTLFAALAVYELVIVVERSLRRGGWKKLN